MCCRNSTPDDLFDLIAGGRITQFFGVPAIYQAFSLHPGLDASTCRVRGYACGGAALPVDLIRFFADRGGGHLQRLRHDRDRPDRLPAGPRPGDRAGSARSASRR
jgi:acyl-CoA synthetase (AMP-forming)/AMP-acid ligase II